jgi:hypothetical protein
MAVEVDLVVFGCVRRRQHLQGLLALRLVGEDGGRGSHIAHNYLLSILARMVVVFLGRCRIQGDRRVLDRRVLLRKVRLLELLYWRHRVFRFFHRAQCWLQEVRVFFLGCRDQALRGSAREVSWRGKVPLRCLGRLHGDSLVMPLLAVQMRVVALR